MAKEWSDAVLGRRRDWTGAAMLLTGKAMPDGKPEGYYRCTGHDWDPDTGWPSRNHYDYLGDTMPQGEPVYRNDNTRWDLKAIPRTVFPWKWLWIDLVLFLGLIWYVSWVPGGWGDNTNWAPFVVIATPVVLGPLWRWFYAIEPVRASKIAIVFMAVMGAWAAKQKADNQEIRAEQQYWTQFAREHAGWRQ